MQREPEPIAEQVPPTTLAAPGPSRITKWSSTEPSESPASSSSSARNQPVADRPRASGSGDRVERQGSVEAELDDEAPRLREPAVGDRLDARPSPIGSV